jgi:hypothetical protein
MLASGSVELAIARGATGVTVIVTVACTLGFALLVTVIVTGVLLDTLGATKAPVLEIVPPLAVHVTLVFELPVTWAVNCSCPWDAMVALVGEIQSLAPDVRAATTIWVEVEPYSSGRTPIGPRAGFDTNCGLGVPDCLPGRVEA